ncbi:hypothetical protein SARC_02742 [Sphaeroforma arctica JP610]|uniref:Core-binding (CB) domain-containing protein n=1 Tax=Sphaeroforma arctica JP610 TaxID=667725 RepID=A0A0L0G806_9EUKA|nr:hypothetical protein SARC_02742 [Sphaeroforma arctica JP610]KNC85049.1 hypothetical protein SARC_02742 [Sphaeroforma arctica JP610]|eukprot:XP_014158951.1 hypothetical protein SARC_02742 [Sphaeroforma arctica JP610]
MRAELDYNTVIQQLNNGGLAEGTQRNYQVAMNYWNKYASENSIDSAVPHRKHMIAFLAHCFFDNAHPNKVRAIRAAINSYARQHAMPLISEDDWQRSIQGYVNPYHRIGRYNTSPTRPKVDASGIVRILDAPGIANAWKALLTVFWLTGARRHTNQTFAADSFTFMSETHKLLIDLKKKKRQERSSQAVSISRPVDVTTYEFLDKYLPDAFRPPYF